jgi:uncharacterized membrane protein
MTPTAAVLLLISASLHATWNLLGKREHPTAAFMLASNLLGCLCLLPVLLIFNRALASFSGAVWGYLILTGVFQAVYFIGLAGAYRAGDLSIVYPLARSAPVLLVTVLTLLLSHEQPLSSLAVVGMIAIVVGCLILPMQSFSDFRPKNYWNWMSLLALLAAGGTVGYTLVDNAALHLLLQGGAIALGGTLAYAFMEGVTTSFWLAVFVLVRQTDRRALFAIERGSLRSAAQVGVVMFLAYILVLIAMGFVTNVSYVVAFRQTSIPLGALLGITVLKEPRPLPKLIGVAVTFAGLVLVGLG